MDNINNINLTNDNVYIEELISIKNKNNFERK